MAPLEVQHASSCCQHAWSSRGLSTGSHCSAAAAPPPPASMVLASTLVTLGFGEAKLKVSHLIRSWKRKIQGW